MTKIYMPVMQGARVVLRPAQIQDIEDRLQLGPNPEYHLYFGDDKTTMRSATELQKMWFDDIVSNDKSYNNYVDTQIAQIEIAGKWAGSVSLAKIDLYHRRADLVVGIYDRKYWGNGYGVEVTRLTLEYAFGMLLLHRISANILKTNPRSLIAAQKVGFKIEGVLRDYFFINGEWIDGVTVAILDEEYRGT